MISTRSMYQSYLAIAYAHWLIMPYLPHARGFFFANQRIDGLGPGSANANYGMLREMRGPCSLIQMYASHTPRGSLQTYAGAPSSSRQASSVVPGESASNFSSATGSSTIVRT